MICSRCECGHHFACRDGEGEPFDIKDGVAICDCASTFHEDERYEGVLKMARRRKGGAIEVRRSRILNHVAAFNVYLRRWVMSPTDDELGRVCATDWEKRITKFLRGKRNGK